MKPGEYVTALYRTVRQADFPFTMWFVNEETGELLDWFIVTDPGAIRVPDFAPIKVTVAIGWPDGVLRIQETALD